MYEFKVGDLVTVKKFRDNPVSMPPPLAIVVSLEALAFDRIMIQHLNGALREMAAPEHWRVVSSA